MTHTPASDHCQRWTKRRHTWKHPSDGGFDPTRYRVEPVHETDAGLFVITNHYAASMPAASHCYGLRQDGQLVGAAVLSVPMQQSVLTNVFPDLEPYEESLELGRFVLLDDVPANGESWFLGQMFGLAEVDGVRGIVSFADPVQRRRIVTELGPDGEELEREQLIMPGHVGLIYQATNARALGRSTPRTLVWVPRQGRVLSARTMQKIRAQERGSDGAEKLLVTWGARPRVAGQNPTAWLRQALDDVGAQRVRHPGNYRYAWAVGPRRVKRAVHIALPSTPYPKQLEAA